MSINFGLPPPSREPGVPIKLASAGTAACIAEALTYPLDMAKVRLMIQGEGAKRGSKLLYHGIFGTIKTVAKTEGIRGLYGGMVAGFHRQMVLGSVRIGFYDTAKEKFGRFWDGEEMTSDRQPSNATRISASLTTGITAALVGQPTDVVKVRMQAQGATGVVRYSSALSAYKTIATQEGIKRGLWKGFVPNAARTAVVNSAEIVSYDIIKTVILKHDLMSDNAPLHLVAAACAAFITTMVSCPIDVVKTRYTNSTMGQYSSIGHCIVNMWNEKKVAAFYKGCVPSFCRLATWNIIMFMSYEQLKRALCLASDHASKKKMVRKLSARQNKWE